VAYQAEIDAPPKWQAPDHPRPGRASSLAGDARPLLQCSLSCSKALFLVTRCLKLVDYNPAAEALLEPGGDLQVVGGQLAFVDKPRTSALQLFVGSLDGGPAGWAFRRSCGSLVMVRADPVRGSPVGKGPADMESDLIVLTAYPSDPEDRYVWADFAPHFDLTRSESAVVKRLVVGKPASVVAEELELSIETIRTHVRRVYNKLGISSREQLFAIAGQFRLD